MGEAPPPVGATMPVEDLPKTGPSKKAQDEENFFDSTGHKKLDLNVRRLAAYGALVLAVVLFAAGLIAVAIFLGLLCPKIGPAKPEAWHIVVAVLAALFSVPTVLLVAVLRSTNGKGAEADFQSLHEAVGERVVGLLDKHLKGD